MFEQWYNDFLASQTAMNVIQASVILVVGVSLAAVLPSRFAGPNLQPQQRWLVHRLLRYTIVALTMTGILHVLGVSLGFLLGTAGILTVAVGFAAQTSASNLISGLFLMAERPFVIGDVIKVGGTTGEVVSIDLLSVRLRTFDNLQVRLPNEAMLKSEVTTLTHYPIRRFDMKVGVAYREDLREVERVLRQVADANPLCLHEPTPLFLVLGFGDSSIDLQFSFWSTLANFIQLRNMMHDEVLRAFEAAGIEIPFPQRTLTAGGEAKAIPVVMAQSAKSTGT
jgi:small-conductance mechanosensitive channel